MQGRATPDKSFLKHQRGAESITANANFLNSFLGFLFLFFNIFSGCCWAPLISVYLGSAILIFSCCCAPSTSVYYSISISIYIFDLDSPDACLCWIFFQSSVIFLSFFPISFSSWKRLPLWTREAFYFMLRIVKCCRLICIYTYSQCLVYLRSHSYGR